MVDARLFQALSDPTRLKILLLLSDSPMNVSSMVAHLKCAQPAVSRHLRVLRETSLIHDMRKGKEVEYSLNHDRLRDAKLYLEALGGGGGQVQARARAGHAGARSEKAGTSAKPRRGAESGSRKSRGRTKRERKKDRPRDERTARSGKQKTTTRVSSQEMPDFVVEREEEDSMDDFLL